MKTNFTSIKLLPAVLLCAASALATDIPEGGDTVNFQLGASTDVVIADLRVSRTGYLFEVVQQLRGTAPALFDLDEGDNDLEGAFKAGQRYLLFLRKSPSGKPVLAASYYSAQPLSAPETAAYTDFVRAYLAAGSNKAALKPLLLKGATSPVPYISYSSVADLSKLRLLTSQDVTALARMLDARQIADPRARSVIVGAIATFRLTDLAPMLEKLAGSRSEAILVRSRSLDALYQLNAISSLRNVAAQIEQDPSLHLRRKIMEIGEKVR